MNQTVKPSYSVEELESIANYLRRKAMTMTYEAGDQGGHIAPALSIIEIMTVLYFNVMRYDTGNPKWSDRDRFILSKGHAVLGYYPVLAKAGFFPEEVLKTFEQKDSYLGGHPCSAVIPGIDISSGSLGHGLSIGLGMAKSAKMDNKDYNVYVLLGDGEINEGAVWEAVMMAAHLNMDNLTAIIDKNNMQIDGFTKDVLNMDPLKDKFISFGWAVSECNGHDAADLIDAFNTKVPGKPKVIIANTTKGKGVSFIENNFDFHHALINENQLNIALKELN